MARPSALDAVTVAWATGALAALVTRPTTVPTVASAPPACARVGTGAPSARTDAATAAVSVFMTATENLRVRAGTPSGRHASGGGVSTALRNRARAAALPGADYCGLMALRCLRSTYF